MKECALATLAASSISIWVASGRPNNMFSLMLVAKSAGSWLTSPICCLSHFNFSVFMSFPSSRSCPAYKLIISWDSHSKTCLHINTWNSLQLPNISLRCPSHDVWMYKGTFSFLAHQPKLITGARQNIQHIYTDYVYDMYIVCIYTDIHQCFLFVYTRLVSMKSGK